MTETLAEPRSARVLDPIERISEVLFGLFMVLTFTGTLSVADSGRDDVRNMLVAAIGCNIAWGFVDGVMYVLRNLVDARAQGHADARGARRRRPGAGARHHPPGDRQRVGACSARRSSSACAVGSSTSRAAVGSRSVTARDLRGAVGVFLLVFLSTFPVVLPFVFIADPGVAKRRRPRSRSSMLFLCGYAWGRYAGLKPWRTGLVMVLLGVIVEAIVIALGG